MDIAALKELGAYGLLLLTGYYTLMKGGPKLWTLITGFITQREQMMTDTLAKIFTHADEDRALYVEQMSGLKAVITSELQKERDFHAAALVNERAFWEQVMTGRFRNENGSGTSPRA